MKRTSATSRRAPKPTSKSPTNFQHSVGSQLAKAHAQELRLLAYEIHDGLIQDLIAAKMIAESSLAAHPRLKDVLSPVIDQLTKAITEARRLVRDMRPPALERGLVQALEDLVEEHRSVDKQEIQFTHPVGFGGFDPMIESTLFRIAQQSVNNAARHAKANSVSMKLSTTGRDIVLQIADDGLGFDPKQAVPNHFGLASIRERARMCGGRATIRSRPGEGTRITVRVPRYWKKTSDEAARHRKSAKT